MTPEQKKNLGAAMNRYREARGWKAITLADIVKEYVESFPNGESPNEADVEAFRRNYVALFGEA